MKIKSFILFIAVLLSLLTFDTKQLFAQDMPFRVVVEKDDGNETIDCATLKEAFGDYVCSTNPPTKITITQIGDYVNTEWQTQTYLPTSYIVNDVVLELDKNKRFVDGLNLNVQSGSLTINTSDGEPLNDGNYLHTQISNSGILNINGGTYTGDKIIVNYSYATTNITNGKFTGDANLIENQISGTLNITDGIFKAEVTEETEYNHYSAIYSRGSVFVKDGEFTLNGTTQNADEEIWAAIFVDNDPSVIEGGKFKQTVSTTSTASSSNIYCAAYIGGTTYISGGEFDGDIALFARTYTYISNAKLTGKNYSLWDDGYYENYSNHNYVSFGDWTYKTYNSMFEKVEFLGKLKRGGSDYTNEDIRFVDADKKGIGEKYNSNQELLNKDSPITSFSAVEREKPFEGKIIKDDKVIESKRFALLAYAIDKEKYSQNTDWANVKLEVSNIGDYNILEKGTVLVCNDDYGNPIGKTIDYNCELNLTGSYQLVDTIDITINEGGNLVVNYEGATDQDKLFSFFDVNGGTLTINSGTFYNDYAVVAVENNGKATINGGVFITRVGNLKEFNLSTRHRKMESNFVVNRGGILEIKDGNFSYANYEGNTSEGAVPDLYGVHTSAGTTKIYNGTFDPTIENTVQSTRPDNTVFLENGEVIIEDIEIIGDKDQVFNCGVSVNGGTAIIEKGTFAGGKAAVSVNGGQVDINNGEFKSANTMSGDAVVVNGGTINIKDGTFDAMAGQYGSGVYVQGGKINISGGKFKGKNDALNAFTQSGVLVADISLTGGEYEGGYWAVTNSAHKSSNSADVGNILADGYAFFDGDRQLSFVVNGNEVYETYSAYGQLGGDDAEIYKKLKVAKANAYVLTYLDFEEKHHEITKAQNSNQYRNLVLHGVYGDKLSELTLCYTYTSNNEIVYSPVYLCQYKNEEYTVLSDVKMSVKVDDEYIDIDKLDAENDPVIDVVNTSSYNLKLSTDVTSKSLDNVTVEIDKKVITATLEDMSVEYGDETVIFPDYFEFTTKADDKVIDIVNNDVKAKSQYKVYDKNGDEVDYDAVSDFPVGSYTVKVEGSSLEFDNYKVEDEYVEGKLSITKKTPEVKVFADNLITLPGATVYFYINPEITTSFYITAKSKDVPVELTDDAVLKLTLDDEEVEVKRLSQTSNCFAFKVPDGAGEEKEYSYKLSITLGENYKTIDEKFTIKVAKSVLKNEPGKNIWYSEYELKPVVGKIIIQGSQVVEETITIETEGENEVVFNIVDENGNVILEDYKITVMVDKTPPVIEEMQVYVTAGLMINGVRENTVNIEGAKWTPNVNPEDLQQFIFRTGDTLIFSFEDVYIDGNQEIKQGSGVSSESVMYSWDNQDSYQQMDEPSRLCIKERKSGILYIKATDKVNNEVIYVYNLAFFEKSTFADSNSDTITTAPVYYCGKDFKDLKFEITRNGNDLYLTGDEQFTVETTSTSYIITLTAEYLKTLVPNSEKNQLNLRINPLGINGWVNGNMGIEPVPYESQIMVIDIDVTYKIVPEKYEFSGPEYGACAGEKIVFDIKSVNQNYSTLFDSVSVFGIQEVDHVECEIPEVDGGTTAVPVIFKKRAEQLNLTFTDTVYLDYSFAFSESYNIRVYDDVWAINNHDNRFNSFQWYLNGKPMEGENKQFIYLEPYLVETNYGAIIYAMVQSNDGLLKVCPAKDQVLIGKKVGIVRTVTVYPNPTLANRQFSIELKNFGDDEYDKLKIDIYNSLGLLSKRVNAVEPINNITLPSGFYTGTVLRNGKQILTFKVIVK
ncbi:MAG: T9SS type A sorting domain-containing protein [Bacteroidales bacterium]|nr:T9SS type A sorting domain-containing protein [Bacteroidales bacterium]